MEREEFIVIPQFGSYELSNRLRVRSRRRTKAKILKPLFDRHNYLYARLYDDNGKAHNIRLINLWQSLFGNTATCSEPYNPFNYQTNYNPFNEITEE